MLNIEVAQDSFWQFARFWKNGETATFELSCKHGLLEMKMSTKVGHPANMHFPPPPHVPPPPPFIKRKFPSQLRSHIRRQQTQAEEAPNVDKSKSNDGKEMEAEEESNGIPLQLSS